VIRRATGKTVGTVLREDIAGPLGADVHIGLAQAEHSRVADFAWPEATVPTSGGRPPQTPPTLPDGAPAGPRPGTASPPRPVPPPLADQPRMIANAYANPADLSGIGVVNTAAWRAAEVPSANAHATAAGVARVYAALAAGGTLDGVGVVDPAALADAVTEHAYGPDLVLQRPSRFGLGFQLTQPQRPLGRGPRAFGHFGAGGSLGFCDPDAGIAFGYVTGQMGPRWQNPRNRALINAVFACL
jgi:CubicO group peptidase (beta-lactamase class C family)